MQATASQFNIEMGDGQRRDVLCELEALYMGIDEDDDMKDAKKALETAMLVITEPLRSHSELFGDEGLGLVWNSPCLCEECRSESD